MLMRWECPECGKKGDVKIVARPPIGELLSMITDVTHDHKTQSPDCPVTKRPAGYVRILLFEKPPEEHSGIFVKEKKE